MIMQMLRIPQLLDALIFLAEWLDDQMAQSFSEVNLYGTNGRILHPFIAHEPTSREESIPPWPKQKAECIKKSTNPLLDKQNRECPK